MAESKKKFEVSIAHVVVACAVVVGFGLFAWLTLAPPAPKSSVTVLTADARAYLEFLKLRDVQPQTSEGYIQNSLFEILGTIANTGSRNVKIVKVTCVFRDVTQQEIKRELVSVVKDGALNAGATRSFRLAFDDVPDTWNHAMPDLVIAEIRFAQ